MCDLFVVYSDRWEKGSSKENLEILRQNRQHMLFFEHNICSKRRKLELKEHPDAA
jgi:hypothetical protein